MSRKGADLLQAHGADDGHELHNFPAPSQPAVSEEHPRQGGCDRVTKNSEVKLADIAQTEPLGRSEAQQQFSDLGSVWVRNLKLSLIHRSFAWLSDR